MMAILLGTPKYIPHHFLVISRFCTCILRPFGRQQKQENTRPIIVPFTLLRKELDSHWGASAAHSMFIPRFMSECFVLERDTCVVQMHEGLPVKVMTSSRPHIINWGLVKYELLQVGVKGHRCERDHLLAGTSVESSSGSARPPINQRSKTPK